MRGTEKAVIGALFAIVVSLIAGAWSSLAAEVKDLDVRERVAVVETKSESDQKRLQRIEDKLDLLLERTAGQ